VTAPQAEALAEHNIHDIDALSGTTVDELVEILDLSLDEAETILTAAKAVVAMRESIHEGSAATDETEVLAKDEYAGEDESFSSEDETVLVGEIESTEDLTAEGYDEAVESGLPYRAEPEVPAKYSADPVALTEVEPISSDEIVLQEIGRDLRPDTITPAPDVTSSGAGALSNLADVEEDVFTAEPTADSTSIQAINSAPESTEAAAIGSNDEEKQDASPDAAE
jgi:hypothetical protein